MSWNHSRSFQDLLRFRSEAATGCGLDREAVGLLFGRFTFSSSVRRRALIGRICETVRVLKMEDRLARYELCYVFLVSGIDLFVDSIFIFVDAVRVLNRSYSRFKVSPAGYFPRFLGIREQGLLDYTFR